MKVCIVNFTKYLQGEMIAKWVELPLSDEELQDVFIEIKTATKTNGNYVGYYLDKINNIVCSERMVTSYTGFPVTLYGKLFPEEMNMLALLWDLLDNEKRSDVLTYIEKHDIRPTVMEAANIIIQCKQDIDLHKYNYEEAMTIAIQEYLR